MSKTALSLHGAVCTKLTLLFVALIVSGCGSKAIDPDLIADAQASFDQAMKDVEDEKWESAALSFEAALTPGAGLSPDLYAAARLERAKCYARLKRFDKAHADLDIASEGNINLAIVHATRSFVFKQEGKQAEAAEEMKNAKKIDRKVKTVR